MPVLFFSFMQQFPYLSSWILSLLCSCRSPNTWPIPTSAQLPSCVTMPVWVLTKAQVLSSFVVKGVTSAENNISNTVGADVTPWGKICICTPTWSNDTCTVRAEFAFLYHEMRLCEDPPELFGLHVLWVTGNGVQHLMWNAIKTKYYLYNILDYLFGGLKVMSVASVKK